MIAKTLSAVLKPKAGGSPRLALQRLLMLRALVTALAIVGALIFESVSTLRIPDLLIPAVLAAVVLSLAFTVWRLRQPWLVSSHELFAQLLIDVALLLAILVYTGGASNPLISYLLVLLAVGATLLTQLYMSIFTLMAILIYTLFLAAELRNGSDPAHAAHMMGQQQEDTFQLHLVGMWVTFVVSAILITVFVTRMAAAIRSRELELARGRENAMRNEQLVAIGTLAAGTAHALGTPLSTMSVLLADLDQESEESLRSKPIKADISLLRQQVIRCKDSLAQLTRFYNSGNTSGVQCQTLAELRREIQDYIVNMHPAAAVDFVLEPGSESTLLVREPILKHAFINIVENAIKAARSRVVITLSSLPDSAAIELSVQDDGPGIPAQVMENLGEPFISTRRDSMGLGIFLANAAIERLGGSMQLFNTEGGGARSIIRLPVAGPQDNEAGA